MASRTVSSSHTNIIISTVCLQQAFLDHALASEDDATADDELDKAMKAFVEDARIFQREHGRTHTFNFVRRD